MIGISLRIALGGGVQCREKSRFSRMLMLYRRTEMNRLLTLRHDAALFRLCHVFATLVLVLHIVTKLSYTGR
jgi:hypothetical protein